MATPDDGRYTPHMRLLALLVLSAAWAGMPPPKASLSGKAAWTYKVLDWRTLYMPSKDAPGAFDAVELHQGYAIVSEASPSLKNVFGPAGQSRITEDDEVAGKDFPGRDRIRIVEDGRGGSRLEVEWAMLERDGSAMPAAEARYSVPLTRFGDGWAVAVPASRPHFDAQARLQGEAVRGHLEADGWRVSGLRASSTPPAAEQALRLVPESGGWRFLSATPFTMTVRAAVSK